MTTTPDLNPEHESPNAAEIERILANSWRVDVNGWIYTRLHGDPHQMGFQNGYLLAHEIESMLERIKLYVEGAYKRNWRFFCETGMQLYWPKLPEEYRTEIKGVVAGTRARQVSNIGLEDIVALNGFFDTVSYHYWLRAKEGQTPSASGGEEHCSAFIATGESTKDGKIILAHNTWFWYLWAVGYNIIVDASPTSGNEFLMQTCPGIICSGTDWYLGISGLVVAETTISGMTTFNPRGTPYFMRARRAIQYAKTVDEWVTTMVKDNNGGYANDWLIGDIKTGEVACLELGTFNYDLDRTFDGAFMGSNVATSEKVRGETALDYGEMSASHTARRERWKQIMESSRGILDVGVARKFLADHHDTHSGSERPNRNTICGHVELDNRGYPEWEQRPYSPMGAHDGKVTSGDLASTGAFWAHWGAPCDTPFIADSFLNQHPEHNWQKPRLRSIEPYPWTLFSTYPKWATSRI